jgi:hypothetical protein
MDPVLELQGAIIARLQASAGVTAIVPAGRIADIPQAGWHQGQDRAPYISIGTSNYQSEDADCIYGGEAMMQVDCWSISGNLSEVRRVADAVRRALRGWEPTLTTSALVTFNHWRTDYVRAAPINQASIRYTAIIEEP